MQTALNPGVKLLLMVVVVTKRGVNLGKRQVRMLKVNFLWTPTMRNHIERHFDDLSVGYHQSKPRRAHRAVCGPLLGPQLQA